MKTASYVLLGLGLFLLADGAVYFVTAHEYVGGPLILTASVTFIFLGLVTRGIARRFERANPSLTPPIEEAQVEPEHVGATIWPLGFSVAAVVLAAGAVTAHWLLIPGVALFVAAAGGWFVDVKRQHAHARDHSPATAAPVEPGRTE
jgi:O-antigen/teichoic acid export membrane protein